MLTREQALQVINTERDYQDSAWPAHDAQGNTEHCLTSVQVYLRKAEDAWITEGYPETKTQQQLAKIAAIIVRLLERGHGTEELLKGLR
jgi:hypothetical protein